METDLGDLLVKLRAIKLALDNTGLMQGAANIAGTLLGVLASLVVAWKVYLWISATVAKVMSLTGKATLFAYRLVRPERKVEEAAALVLAHLDSQDAIVNTDEYGITELVTESLTFRVGSQKNILSIKTDAGYDLLPDLLPQDRKLIDRKVPQTIARVLERDRVSRLKTIPSHARSEA